jgi:hypothetical protein
VLGAILLALASAAHAVPIRVVFDDPVGAGFNDPQLGPARRGAFRFAVGIWASAVRRSVPVVVTASMASLGGDATSAPLARTAAYSLHRNFPGAPVPDTWYPAALASQLRTPPDDVNDAAPEIVVVVNADIDRGIGPGGKKFDYGTDGTEDIDFVSIVLHELAHGLGFHSETRSAGLCTGGGNAGAACRTPADCGGGTCDTSVAGAWAHAFPAIYDRYLTQNGSGPIATMSAAQRTIAVTSDALFFSGPRVDGMNGGDAKVFAPPLVVPGSSVSHWDPSFTPDQLLEPGYVHPNHALGLALAALADEGWPSCPVDRAVGVLCALEAAQDLLAEPLPACRTACVHSMTRRLALVSRLVQGAAPPARRRCRRARHAAAVATDLALRVRGLRDAGRLGGAGVLLVDQAERIRVRTGALAGRLCAGGLP